MILQSTPVLFVDAVEPSEAFFAKLGFERTVAVPDGDDDAVGFVILMQGGRNDSGLGVMIQTRQSARDDMTRRGVRARRTRRARRTAGRTNDA